MRCRIASWRIKRRPRAEEGSSLPKQLEDVPSSSWSVRSDGRWRGLKHGKSLRAKALSYSEGAGGMTRGDGALQEYELDAAPGPSASNQAPEFALAWKRLNRPALWANRYKFGHTCSYTGLSVYGSLP